MQVWQKIWPKYLKYGGWSPASDQVCLEKTYVSAENICRNRRENVLVSVK